MLHQFLQRIINTLHELSIPYMLSGSVALGVYTVARTTRDVDIVIQLRLSDVKRFVAAFQDWYCDEMMIEEEIKRRGMFNIIDYVETGYKADFILQKQDAFNQSEFQRRIKTDVLGYELWVVSLEDLILSKLKWMQDSESERQKLDIQSLVEDNEVDWEYIQKWVTALNLKTYNLFP
jgi:predicted nucleotidyltransferase